MKTPEIFYSRELNPPFLTLSEEESQHCVKVLRKNTGDVVQVIDGLGHLYEGTLEILHKNKPARVLIRNTTFFGEPGHRSGFHLAIAPTKNADRMEWLIEKTVELGIASISFLQCEHSERSHLKPERLEKIAIAALKQSRQYWLPEIKATTSFSSFVDKLPSSTQSFLAHCLSTEKQELGLLITQPEVCVLIGPEGDFSKTEIDLALKKGLIPVSLGNSRLRTETAGLYACAIYRSIQGS